MAVMAEPDNTPLPGTVFTPRQVRVLKIAVIAMGLLLVGGFAFVLGTIVYQASRVGQDGTAGETVLTSEEAGLDVDLPVPQGTTVGAVALDGNRLAPPLHSSGGPEIVIVDLGSGKVLARIK